MVFENVSHRGEGGSWEATMYIEMVHLFFYVFFFSSFESYKY